ncbi:MAG: protein phosphatase 1 regulatory subunit 42 [Melioribacteraceae bacterium]|jgi:hypothetical protein|nr:protein phosphatase 1 regulatory subunit 42 [Melioribacteraceae bacterium]MDD3982817.1 leucine-rich repeat domain-containing protein [Candidatus Omnitrophota bacterium]
MPFLNNNKLEIVLWWDRIPRKAYDKYICGLCNKPIDDEQIIVTENATEDPWGVRKTSERMSCHEICFESVSKYYYSITPRKFIDLLHKNVDQAEFEAILLSIKNPLEITYINAQDNKIIRIKGIDRFPNLERLNLNQNKISKIGGLDNNTKLKGIHLGWNQIQKLEGLDKLVNLEWIYLQNNQIIKIEGLENNINLNELLLQDNRINTTDGMDVFLKLTKLKKVVLSRNPIKNPPMIGTNG